MHVPLVHVRRASHRSPAAQSHPSDPMGHGDNPNCFVTSYSHTGSTPSSTSSSLLAWQTRPGSHTNPVTHAQCNDPVGHDVPFARAAKKATGQHGGWRHTATQHVVALEVAAARSTGRASASLGTYAAQRRLFANTVETLGTIVTHAPLVAEAAGRASNAQPHATNVPVAHTSNVTARRLCVARTAERSRQTRGWKGVKRSRLRRVFGWGCGRCSRLRCRRGSGRRWHQKLDGRQLAPFLHKQLLVLSQGWLQCGVSSVHDKARLDCAHANSVWLTRPVCAHHAVTATVAISTGARSTDGTARGTHTVCVNATVACV
mmetsp:Transcript_13503/g.42511  ORF Transcript_13503/g.42511 Transcript_13503/m.42511 type:complete len:317 (+) Transcript_13503:581-1531(+)